MIGRRTIRCAIYTRKSSEEGLEQSFNSLQAQREACEAYIASQKHEGWHAIPTHYDDGGFSGGSMERPALQKLLEDIEAGKVNVVMVYKVDRLTRSLADFAKIIETFDANNVSFVSVTQQFNTTSSMGRLTLNVLLSFAQFEREVTGERIRDKIAASKKKGMWMGGFVPLGYDLKDRQLFVNRGEAKIIREIFEQYIHFERVSRLQQYLQEKKILTKVRRSESGAVSGGQPFSRGALYKILNNRLYLGEIEHKGNVYPGQHEAIIDRTTWSKAAALLAENNRGNRLPGMPQEGGLLTGILFDAAGNRFTPTHSVKNGKRYRYYTSQAVIQGRRSPTSITRIPAHEIEEVVGSRICTALTSATELAALLRKAGTCDSALRSALDGGRSLAKETPPAQFAQRCRTFLKRVIIADDRASIEMDPVEFMGAVLEVDTSSTPKAKLSLSCAPNAALTLDCQFQLQHWSNELRMVLPGVPAPKSDQETGLVRSIARARHWYEQIASGEVYSLDQIAKQINATPTYVSRIFSLAGLSPAVVESILSGGQAWNENTNALSMMPIGWQEGGSPRGLEDQEAKTAPQCHR